MPELTTAHKDAIRKSWALVAQDVKGNGVAIFLRLFTDYPHLKDYFKIFQGKSLEELATSPVLRAHGSSVIFSLSSVIDSLDDVDCMVEIWKKVIIAHLGRGIEKMEPYENVFATVLKVLEEKLGPAGAFDAQTKEAWVTAVGVIHGIITANLAEQIKLKGKA